MNSICYVRFVTLTLLLAFVGLVGGQGTNNNAFPIQRVVVTEAELVGLLKRVDAGALVRLPANEFDALLKAAQQQANPKRGQPALTEARYRAKLLHDRLEENSLIGTAEWKIRRHPNDARHMALAGLQLAIRQAHWPDGQDAALYQRTGEGAYLDVPQPATNTLNLEWSLRGLPEPAELRFSLQVPPAAIASLDLELPNTLTPYFLDDDVIASGPTPTENGWGTWRIAMGSVARLELVLRRNDAPPPLLLGRLNSTIRLGDVDGTARYEYRFDCALGGFTQLAFEHDSTLTPTGVKVNNLDSWTIQTNDDGRRTIAVRLREPTRSATVVLTAALNVPKPPQRFTTPTLVCKNSILRSETLRWIVSDRVDMQHWSAGQYRIVQAEHLADRTFAIDLEPTILAEPKMPFVPPSAIVVPRQPNDTHVTQQTRWTINTKEQLLQTTLRYTNRDGRLSSVVVRLPDQWKIEQIECMGRDLDETLESPNMLRLNLPRSPNPNEAWETTIRLKRLNVDRSFVGRDLPIPDVEPLGVRTRDGRLTVVVEPAWQATWNGDAGSPPLQTDATTNELQLTHDREGPTGTIRLHVREPRYDVQVESDLTATSNAVHVRSHLRWQAISGTLSTLQWWTPSLVEEPWVWRDVQGRRLGDAVRVTPLELAARLTAMNSADAWSQLTAQVATRYAGYWWTLTLPKNSDREIQLESSYQLAANEYETKPLIAGAAASVLAVDEPQRWPLLWVKHAQFKARVQIDEQEQSPRTTRVLTYGVKMPWQEGPAQAAVPAHLSPTQLIGTLGDDGSLHHSYRFRVLNWSQPLLPVQLPEGATLLSVLVNGRRQHLAQPEHGQFNLAIPQTQTWVNVAITYQMRAFAGLAGRLPSIAPTIADFNPSIQYVWRISPRWRSLTRRDWLQQPSATHIGMPWPDASKAWLPMRRLAFDQRLTDFTAQTRDEWLAHLKAEYPQRSVVVDQRALLHWPGGQTETWTVWERNDLVIVTSRAEFSMWQQHVPLDGDFPTTIEAALMQAAQFGQDVSGRFVQLGDEQQFTGDAEVMQIDWTILEQRDPSTPVHIVSFNMLQLGLWILALLPLPWAVWRYHLRSTPIVLAFWLTAMLVALFLLPPWRPWVVVPLTGALVACAWQAFRCRWQPPSSRSTRSRSTTISHRVLTSIAVVAGCATALQAADMVPKVYVLMGPSNTPKEVLVPPLLLDQLRHAASGATPATVQITHADYHGTTDGTSATITARYRIVLTDDQPNRLRLPFGNVKLREVLVDGAPTAKIEADGNDLDLTIQGAGTHRVQVQFVMSIRSTNSKEVRFNIPEVPQAKLQFEVAAPATRLRLAGWRGAVQHRTTAKTDTIAVDLGSAATIHVLWQAAGKESTPSFRVREASVWTVGANQSLLRTAIEYRVESGVATQLKLQLPNDGEIASVDLRQEGATTAAIRDWSITRNNNGPRTLTVQLQFPLAGRAVLQLEMVPSQRLPMRPTLRVPTTQQPDREVYVALAVEPGVEWIDANPDGLTPIEGLPAFQTVWSSLWSQPTGETLHTAYRGTNKESAKLSGTLRQPPMHSVHHQVDWTLYPEQLVGQVNSRWTSQERLSLLEWTIPNGYELLSLRIVGQHRWERVGNRVRVWLDKPANTATVDWRIRQRLTIDPQGRELAIPTPNVGSERSTCQARIQATSGLVLLVNASGATTEHGWKPASNTTLRLRVFPANDAVQASIDRTVEWSREVLAVHHRVTWDTPPAQRPHVVWLRFPTGTPNDVSLMLPKGWTARVKGSGSQRAWEIVLPPRTTDEPLRLTTRFPTTGNDRWPLPRLELWNGQQPVVLRSQTVAVPTKAVVLDTDDGLLMEAVGRYRSVSNDWQATIVRSGGQQSHVAIERSTITAAYLGREWHYHARYHVRLPAELTAQLLVEHLRPAMLTVHLDDVIQSPRPAYLLEPTVKTIDVQWRSSELRTITPRFAHAGETWQPAGEWFIRPPDGYVLQGVGKSRLFRPEQPWTHESGLVQHQHIDADQTRTFTFELLPVQQLARSELVGIVASLSLLVMLVCIPRRCYCERIVLAAIAGLAFLGTAGGPWLIVFLVAWCWRILDAFRWWQGSPTTTPITST